MSSRSSAVVWKYELYVDDRFAIDLPVGATVLRIACQQGRPMLWALVDPDEPRAARYFRTVGTGQVLAEAHRWTYRGTYDTDGQTLVWHVFEQV